MADVEDTSSVSDPNGDYSASDGGNQSVDAPEGDGRTLDNVRGELVRKHDKLSGEVQELKGMFQQFLDSQKPKENAPQPQPQPWQQRYQNTGPQVFSPGPVSQFGAPRPELAQYNDADLTQALGLPQLNEYQKQVIREEIALRNSTRVVEGIIEKRDAESKRLSLQEQSREAAFRAFPALRDKNSEFSKRVAKELAQQRKQYGEFPSDEFDVPNRVAREMNVEVTRSTSGFTAPGSGDYHRNEPDAPQGIPDSEYDALAKKFAEALPIRRNKQGKMERVKFNKKNVVDRSKLYKESEQLYRGKKVIG